METLASRPGRNAFTSTKKMSVGIASMFACPGTVSVENLDVTSMTRSARGTAGAPGRNVRQKSGLNREIMRSGWGLLVRRLEDKAPGRVEKITIDVSCLRMDMPGAVGRA